MPGLSGRKMTFGERRDGVDYQERIGAYAIILKDKCLAAIRTPKGYFLPGGELDEGEGHVECIVRECLEEIGHLVIVKEPVCVAEMFTHHEEIGYLHPVGHFYLAELKEKVKEPFERDHELVWIAMDGIDDAGFQEHQRWAVTLVVGDG